MISVTISRALIFILVLLVDMVGAKNKQKKDRPTPLRYRLVIANVLNVSGNEWYRHSFQVHLTSPPNSRPKRAAIK